MAQRRLDAIAAAPQVRVLLASVMCWMCCCLVGSSSPSGVLGAAGGRDRQRGHERVTTSWARIGRGRWRQLVDARAAPTRR